MNNKNELYIPPHVLEMTTLRPWQQTLLNMSKIRDDKIDIIYESEGNTGKSCMAHYLDLYYGAQIIPPFLPNKRVLKIIHNLELSRTLWIYLEPPQKGDYKPCVKLLRISSLMK